MNHLDIIDSAIVTGGAGFIGSHLVDALIDLDIKVKVLDDLSSGNLDNLSKNKEHKKFLFTKINIKSTEVTKEFKEDIKVVFHLAADPEVRIGFESPEISFDRNINTTFNFLESIRKSNVETILFTSSSTVYGEPDLIPTPEDYGPLIPISHYGSSKIACEGLISSYCYNYGIRGIIFRLANIIGSRSNHGVIWDFINKLQKNKKQLSVLGDGRQTKSYLHVNECIEGFLKGFSNSDKRVDVFNLGNFDNTDVMTIAKIVCNSMSLEEVDIRPTGGVDNGRGWIGDVKKMNLDISKMKKYDWVPKISSTKAVKMVADELVKKGEIINGGN